MKTLRLLLLALSLVTVNAAARQSVPIIDYENVPVTLSSGQPASAEQFKRAFEAAALKRRWQVTHPAPGKMLATYNKDGRHTVSADISYANGLYSVKYRDSFNMNYLPGGDGQGLIHPHYNKWLETILEATRAELARQ